MNTDKKAKAYVGAAIFDGQRLLEGHALVLQGGRVQALVAEDALDPAADITRLDGGILAPGFVDLQVNGGGGVMLNDAPSVETLRTIAEAHERLGTTALLPTLITDTPAQTRAAIEAAVSAVTQGVAGIAGLHLEGPHISLARKGAHDPALIRPMEAADLALLLDAASRLPVLMVTIAPESVTKEQVAALSEAGVLISLGHSDADFETAMAYAAAGARCATHLFNAMSPLQSRAPGLVGAALQEGRLSAGVIADGIHVHPDTLAIALRAKNGPGGIFLVTDAMATAGTDIDSFEINGRQVLRRNGRLTLADGTLAGADLELAAALRLLVHDLGLPIAEALTMATARPAHLAGLDAAHGGLQTGMTADFVHLDDGLKLKAVWRGGEPVFHPPQLLIAAR